MRRTKEDAEKTRLRVIEAALVMFSRHGYSGTTLAMIAQEAGYSRGPIYWHFRNKDDLYQAVLEYSQLPLEALLLEAQAAQDPIEGILDFSSRWLRLLLEDGWFRQSFEILLNKTELTEALTPTLERERQLTCQILDTLTALLERAAQLQMVDERSPRQLALLVYTQLMGITQSWLFAPGLFDLGSEHSFFLDNLRRLLQK
ncbi:TetR family transcriptional regulator [Pseudomonas sp.]|uniref:TetR family transcriptional regulator n=1 Tax=Pseudomonas sp. TaxID=306 RepID=UPI00272CA782|nr:TetR family transcriptional regulator [Pseudomonas sp.]